MPLTEFPGNVGLPFANARAAAGFSFAGAHRRRLFPARAEDRRVGAARQLVGRAGLVASHFRTLATWDAGLLYPGLIYLGLLYPLVRGCPATWSPTSAIFFLVPASHPQPCAGRLPGRGGTEHTVAASGTSGDSLLQRW